MSASAFVRLTALVAPHKSASDVAALLRSVLPSSNSISIAVMQDPSAAKAAFAMTTAAAGLGSPTSGGTGGRARFCALQTAGTAAGSNDGGSGELQPQPQQQPSEGRVSFSDCVRLLLPTPAEHTQPSGYSSFAAREVEPSAGPVVARSTRTTVKLPAAASGTAVKAQFAASVQTNNGGGRGHRALTAPVHRPSFLGATAASRGRVAETAEALMKGPSAAAVRKRSSSRRRHQT